MPFPLSLSFFFLSFFLSFFPSLPLSFFLSFYVCSIQTYFLHLSIYFFASVFRFPSGSISQMRKNEATSIWFRQIQFGSLTTYLPSMYQQIYPSKNTLKGSGSGSQVVSVRTQFTYICHSLVHVLVEERGRVWWKHSKKKPPIRYNNNN